MLTGFLTLLALTLFLGGLAGCSSTPATTGARPARPSQITAINGQFPVLAKGMTAEVIRQKLGNPAEIKPMASPDGKAEVWVYHFEKSWGLRQVVTGTRDVPIITMGLGGAVMTTIQEPIYTQAEKTSVVTLSLLMFNNQLAGQKAQVESSAHYQ